MRARRPRAPARAASARRLSAAVPHLPAPSRTRCRYALGALEVNEFLGREYSQDCPAELAAEAAYELIHRTYPDVPLPPLPANFSCSGEDYLAAQDLYPVKYGGRRGYALILVGYLLVFLASAYLVLAARMRQLVRSS